MFRADLHCHTTFSDGTMTVREVLELAKQVGLSGLSITDHDTVDAYGEAPPIAKELGLLLGAGVEFSSIFRKMSVHILCYDYYLDSPAIKALCERHKKRRTERNKRILEKLTRLSMPILEDELFAMGERTLGRPHIAHLMVQKGYVPTIRHAFNLYIGDGKPCFDPGEGISTEETLAIIKEAGGKSFLAHPHLLEHASRIKELLKLPFDGIECHYAKLNPDQERRWVKIATEKGILISGGSDYHGSVKEHNPLGCSWVGEETFHRIFERPL